MKGGERAGEGREGQGRRNRREVKAGERRGGGKVSTI